MAIAGVGSNPFALGHAVAERGNQQAELYQLLAQRAVEQAANQDAAAGKAQQDFVMGVLKDSKALGELFGAGGVARLLNKPGQALGPVVTDPNGYGNTRDRLALDAMRSGSIKDIMNGINQGVGVGVRPDIDPQMAARLGIPGFRDVLPPSIQAEGMKEGAANSRLAIDHAWRSGESALDRANRLEVERLKNEGRGANGPDDPKYTVEVGPPDMLSGTGKPKVTIRGTGPDPSMLQERLGVTGVTPQGTVPGAPPKLTNLQQDAVNRATTAAAQSGAQVSVVGNDANGNAILSVSNGSATQTIIVDPTGKRVQ